MRASSVVLGLVSAVVACGAFAQQRLGPPSETNPVRHQPTDAAARLGDMPRMIVKFRSTGSTGVAQIQSAASEAAASAAVTKFAARAGVAVSEARALAAGMHALRLEPRAGETFAAQLARVRLDPDVEFAVPDERRFPHAVPNDPLFNGQWYLQNGAYVASSADPSLNTQPSAIHAQAAWDVGVGSSTLVIAVIDTGVLYNHPDLTSRLLPGYDFISDVPTANDGNGRDPDATDAGDWCQGFNSSWHGTRVAGIIGAASNNAVGVAGVTWNPKILPVRVLGKCGGDDSDIIDAMAWAAGLHVPGVPDNPQANWAQIENLSLGSTDACPASYQTVISQLTAGGVVVVVSAGNEAGPVDTPANCPGVVAVAGLRHTGTKVGYSSLGPEVTVGAPGGNCVNDVNNGGPCLFSINTTENDGVTTPGNNTYTDQTNFNVGTSFSAPIVSGIVALMRSVNSAMTTAQLIARLQQGATAYPAPAGVPVCPASDPLTLECACTTSTCGAGMANAENSLQAALRPMAILTGPAPSSVTPGSTANLSGAASFAADGRTISSYLWAIVSGTGTLTSMNTVDTSIVTPNSGGVTVQLTVTDDAGRQDSADWILGQVGVTISPTSASVQAAGGTQTFTATVVNTTNQSVTWQVNGVTFGSALVGRISASGVYTAPATVPSPATVTVTAVSNEDATRMGSAQVTITAAPAPPSSGGGGGGGGALDLLGLLCLVALGRRFAPAWLRGRRES
jgi:serine protease